MERHIDVVLFKQEQHPPPPCDSIRQKTADLQAQGQKRHRPKRTAGEEDETTQVGTSLRDSLHKQLFVTDAKI